MASRSINKVTLLGNLTRDPELKYTPAGAPVCTFGLATNRYWTTAEGQTKEETQYHRVVAWHKVAELCNKLLTKGRKVYLEGRLAYRTFTGKDGQQRTITEIVLDDFIVFSDGRRPSGLDEGGSSPQGPEEALATETAGPSTEIEENPEDKTTKKKSKKKSGEETVNPDDIPF